MSSEHFQQEVDRSNDWQETLFISEDSEEL